ncbi:acyl-CoA dehydrogenase family protein [Jatrophihabitans endophyticus]|uniref:acyl-CoA dehydrogenase family protein n=1 Tax=Jatrophihabitans endophyticus TaxID=1206085 RepID=UPI0019EC054A|nr:acyl-CoA dehydrogenase family protein [Jatrophihabitans endophyticus]MBE7187445.1 acyl-CoA dehydrogenase family protein [Jatrophihabitans endophyticus]
MDFELNDEQQLYRKSLREFVEHDIMPVAREYERAGRYPAEIVETMKQLGLFGLVIPEEYGGLDVDKVSFALTFEEISRGWMGVAGILGSHSVSCWMIAKHGTEEQKRALLPGLATGERRTGLALTEPGAGTDLQGIRTTARRDGDHYVVNGAKMWITNARYADPLPVLVKTDTAAVPAHKGMSILLIDAGTPGFEVTKDIGKLGYKGPESCEVVFTDVRVPVANLLGGVEGRGMQQALSSLETGRINIAARSLGVAQRAYDEALDYAGEREAFGQPIGDFQAIQLRLAEMATQLQAARLLTYWAAAQMDAGKRMDTESGMAKIFASEVALQCATDSMRIHGGYGYSTEFEVERLYRDAPLMSIGEGTNDVLRTVVAKSLLAGKAVVR